MARRRRTSYSWALHVDASEVPVDVYEGYSYARLLAENNREWSRQALRQGPKPFPLTAEQLGEVKRVSGATIRARIADARLALHGRLSDSGIYYRRAQARRRRERGQRRCRAPDCANAIPKEAPASRRYCRDACRRRHHYQRPRLAARAQAAIGEWEAEVVRERVPEIRRLYARACTRSSSELHELVEHVRLGSACPAFLALAALDERGELCAFAYGRRSEGDRWWWQAPLAQELRRKKKPRRWLRQAYVIGELAVAPEAQGRGFGRALLERLLTHPRCRRRGRRRHRPRRGRRRRRRLLPDARLCGPALRLPAQPRGCAEANHAPRQGHSRYSSPRASRRAHSIVSSASIWRLTRIRRSISPKDGASSLSSRACSARATSSWKSSRSESGRARGEGLSSPPFRGGDEAFEAAVWARRMRSTRPRKRASPKTVSAISR